MDASIRQQIKEIVIRYGKVGVPLRNLGDDSDLFAAGMDSLAAVQVMLRIEEQFDIELPDAVLNRRSFASVAALEAALRSVLP